MLERLKHYLRPPVFLDDEDKTFTASLLHVILWSVLLGVVLYGLVNTVTALIGPNQLPIAWLYVIATSVLVLVLQYLAWKGKIRLAAIGINLGLWIILTVAAYSNDGVSGPAYSGYLIVIICTSLLVNWQWGTLAAVASSLMGAFFLWAANDNRLPNGGAAYNAGAYWSANITYFFAASLLLGLAWRVIKRASQQTRYEMTERLKTEQALRRSEQRFRAIFDSVNDAIFVQGLAGGCILEVNQKMCEMYGYTVDEARRLTVEDLSAGYPPYTQQDASRWWQKTAGGQAQIFEWLAKDRAGRLFWVEVNMRRASIDDEDRLLVVVRDIDERKRAAEYGHQIDTGLQAVIDATQELLDCADLDTLYRRAVELGRERLGLERCGLHLLDESRQFLVGTYGTDEQGQTTDERLERVPVEERNEVFTTPDRLWIVLQKSFTYWKDGANRVLPETGWIVATPLRSRQRRIGMLYNDTAISHTPLNAAQQDVAAVYCSLLGGLIELKRTEAALAHERDLLRALMDNIPDTIYFKDADSRFTRINQAQARLLGAATPEEALGKTDADFFGAELAQLFSTEEQHLISSGEPIINRVEYNPTPDGQPRWLSASKVPLTDRAGQIIGLVGISRDVTDRKQAEEKLRESEERFRTAFDTMLEGAQIIGFDWRYIYVNAAAERHNRRPTAELLGNVYMEMWPGIETTHVFSVIKACLDDRLASRLENEFIFPDGARGWFELSIQPVPEGVFILSIDVTDRKQAELALQQREAYLRSILDNFPYWFWLKDTAGRYLAANRTLAQAFGFNQVEELIGRTDEDVTPTMAAQFRADDQEVIDQRSQKFAEEIVIDHGVEKWFEIFKSPIFDAQGGVLGTAGFAHDVTARRQAEAAIRESEALFRYLADNAPALIAMIDDTSRPTYLNRAWQEFRGDIPALPLDDWAERLHPDDRRRYWHEYYAAAQAQRKFTTEYRLRRRDGQYRWLLDTVVPRYTADERFAGFIGIAIDITDRKNAEEALRWSEGRLRLLTDNMVDSISQVDAQQRLVYASPSVERVFGHDLRDVLGRPLYEFVHPEDSSRLYHHLLLATELHTPSLRLEYRYRHAAGHYLWVESEMRLLYDERGEFAGAVFGSRDISARKQAEAEREQLITELEDKNAELERFTYTVSHDLKSPLITIRGFLGFLEKDAATGNLDRLRADIARIVEATTRMQQLLDELLELSRLGHLRNFMEEVSFATVVREALALVQGHITMRGVQVKIADDLPSVYGDRVRLVEVVQNLVDNAVKFMGDQAEPCVTIGLREVERDGMPVFFVRDNGLGIEPQYHERIFGLFNKLDMKSEGTGVGLALVKRIIDLHGGHIWVESQGAGQGSTFFFTLPRSKPASSSRMD